MENRLLQQLRLAQSRGVPLIAVETADQAETMRLLAGEESAVIGQDCITGLVGLNDGGRSVVDVVVKARGEDGEETFQGQPEVAAMECLRTLLEPTAGGVGQWPPGFILMANAHRWVGDAGICQALCLLREECKRRQQVVVLLGPSFSLPAEIRQDVLILDDPLPGIDQLKEIVSGCVEGAREACPEFPCTEQDQEQAAQSLRSLSTFAAEQATSLALKIRPDGGIDLSQLQQRRKKQLEQAQGVSVDEPAERFDSLAGLSQGKDFLARLMQGPSSPIAIAFVDEIDKAMEGSTGGDLSGVSAGFLGAMLSFTQDFEVMGMLLYGMPGAGKSALAKALAGEYGLPFLNWDLGAMRGGIVGESEANIRAAIKVAQSVSAPRRLLLIATCNRVGALPPELEARFGLGSFFFDYPSPEAQEQAFQIWANAFKLSPGIGREPLPPHDKWVGREIRQCCELAWRFNTSLQEAAQFVVPGYIRDADKLQKLREQAHGRFLNIDKPGVFKLDGEEKKQAESSRGRKFSADSPSAMIMAIPSVSPGTLFPSSDEGEQKPSRKIGFVPEKE